jgi:predicted nucleic acid-binding Zn ribbon protein
MPEYVFRCAHCEINFSHVCSMSEFTSRKYFRCPECKKKAQRDFSFDNVQGSVSVSLSDCKTIGHYADKQSSKYSKQQIEDIQEGFKTKKTSGMDELPDGMSRMDKPKSGVKWAKKKKKTRKSSKKRS